MVFINDNVERLRINSSGAIQPGGDGTQDLGSASRRFNNVFAAVGTINTSDEREKSAPQNVDDTILDAWGM